jgi:hypothetical protein
MFRSDIRPKFFLKNIEFCAALVDFTRSASNSQLTTKCFMDWLREERARSKSGKLYPNLFNILLGEKSGDKRKVNS